MQEHLRKAISDLEAAMKSSGADGVIDDEERSELRAVVARLDALLADPDENDGLKDQLEDFAVRFEENHPGVAGVMRGVVDTLTSYGI